MTTAALKCSIPTGFYALLAYVLMLPITLLLAAAIWADKVSGVLYLCTDSLGIFDFIPPFVHPYAGDVYYVSPLRVTLTWAALLTGAFLLPGLIIWVLWRACGKDQSNEDYIERSSLTGRQDSVSASNRVPLARRQC